MRAASTALKNFLAGSTREFYRANLYTITLLTGQVYRYTDADRDLTSGGNSFSSSGPRLSRSTVETALGTEVSKMQLTIADDGSTAVIAGLPILRAIAAGLFDGATVRVDCAIMQNFGDTTTLGTYIAFMGRWASVTKLGRAAAEIEVRSWTELLDTQMPRNLYQPGCLHTLYDAGCTLVKANFAQTGTVASGSTQVTIIPQVAFTQADGYFTLGTITFTSGQNNGLSYSVRLHSGGQLTLYRPTLMPVASGDTFTCYAGCDKQQATCSGKFANLTNFGGQPYIPAPEVAV